MPNRSSQPRGTRIGGTVHTVTIRTRVSEGWVPNSEGKPSDQMVEHEIEGRLVALSASEINNIGQYGEDIKNCFLCPLSTDVDSNDELFAEGIDPALDGTYKIATILYTPNMRRIMLRRTD